MALIINGKRAMLFVLAAVLLGASAVWIDAMTRSRVSAVPVAAQAADPIEKFRTERQQLRAMQKAQLNDIAHDANAEPETAELARRQLIELCAIQEQELTIESILAARGFESPIVTVHSGSVNVLVRAEALNRQQSSVILELVCRETGVMSGDIKIIPIN